MFTGSLEPRRFSIRLPRRLGRPCWCGTRRAPPRPGFAILAQLALVAAAFGCESENIESIQTRMTNHEKEITIEAAGTKIKFRHVPAGKFTMGSPATEEGHHPSEEPARTVEITKAFYLGTYEVTQAQYEAVMGENPSVLKGETLPCYDLGFEDAVEFCKKLSALTGTEITIPTEAQWEYTCRAGTSTRFYSGDREEDLAKVGWYRGNSGDVPHPVGEKEPNAFGLYDMHGNVWEFCLDTPGNGYRDLFDVDPVGQLLGGVRGGNWLFPPEECRSATRAGVSRRLPPAMMGIRLAINVPTK